MLGTDPVTLKTSRNRQFFSPDRFPNRTTRRGYEMLFSGLLANRLTKSFGFAVAILGTPLCFALIHVVQFGIGTHLIALFFAGFTYTVIRFRSGSLWTAVFSHLAINFVIFVPKWAVAIMH